MSKLRYALRKDANQGEIVQALEAIGCDVLVVHEPTDLIVGRNGLTMLLEVKDGKKRASARKLTPNQRKFHGSWRGHKATVTCQDEAIAAVQTHTTRGTR